MTPPPRHLLPVTVAAALLLTLPLWLVRYPAMVDWPNHVLRHRLSVAGDAAPLAAMYEFTWMVQPNLAGDLLSMPLFTLFPALLAGKLLTSLGVLLWVLAPVVLHRAWWGRWSYWPLIAGVAALNAPFALGFENYYLTAPLAVLAYAGWVALRERGYGLLFLLVAGWVVYVGHLFGWGVLGLLVGGHVIGEQLRTRPRPSLRIGGLSIASLLPPFVDFCVRFLFAPWEHSRPDTQWFGSWTQKTLAAFSPVYTFSQVGDALLGLALGGTIILALRRVRFHPVAAVVVGVFAGVTPLMPWTTAGIFYTDARLPPVLVGLFFAATRPPDAPWARPGVLLGGTLALVLLRVGTMLPVWVDNSRRVAELDAALDAVEPGALVLLGSDEQTYRPLSWHAWTYASYRQGFFVPHVFTGGHLLDAAPEYASFDHNNGMPVPVEYLLDWERMAEPHEHWHRWRDRYDLLLVYTDPGAEPALSMPVRIRGSWFVVYEIAGSEADP